MIKWKQYRSLWCQQIGMYDIWGYAVGCTSNAFIAMWRRSPATCGGAGVTIWRLPGRLAWHCRAIWRPAAPLSWGAVRGPFYGAGSTRLCRTPALHASLSSGSMPARPHSLTSVFTHSDHVFQGVPFFLVPWIWKCDSFDTGRRSSLYMAIPFESLTAEDWCNVLDAKFL